MLRPEVLLIAFQPWRFDLAHAADDQRRLLRHAPASIVRIF